ncbi:MAG: fatty acid--CoA ligase [Calditrichaeota bacterium]|nr:fatty acid--CoA ligase [Calditrichota bacterium]
MCDNKILKEEDDSMIYPNEGYDYQLIIKQLLTRPLRVNPTQEIIYRDQFKYTYSDFYKRVQRLANMLADLDAKKGDMVAFMDWDSHRYLEAYFAVPMMGSVLHTINPRLSPEQLLYTINHAEDKILFVHKDFLPLIEKIARQFETVKKIVLIGDGDPSVHSQLETAGEYETLINTYNDVYEFPDMDENTVATAFYTTGTTGNPKGVFFTHRQLVLHTLAAAASIDSYPEPINFIYNDVYMPLTPMFHVHAWGIPYLATMMGVKQIYPGRYEPEMLLKLLVGQKVTFSHCVPTILQMILSAPVVNQIDLSNWKVVIGGSALSKGLAKMAIDKGIRIMTGYGMSETCPILTLAQFKQGMENLSDEEKVEVVTKTGLPIPLVDLRIVDESGKELPPGKKHTGEIVVRAPWLTAGYLKTVEKSKELWRDGWLHTGDVAYYDEEGYVKITDRIKDIIKTGGEWISSLELENLISQCEPVKEVAVIGVPDEKWGERPVAYIVPKPEFKDTITVDVCKKGLQPFVEAGVIEKWVIPDEFIFVDEIPKTSVGKIDKKLLRATYKK